jgi:hypothetical protein
MTASHNAEAASHARERSLAHPRPRALLLGIALVVALTFLLPYVNLSLNKYDWAFRPLALGPLFLLCALIWPVNSILRRARPASALTRSELLLVYAMMAISAAISGEGLFVYAMVNAVQPQFFAAPGNRWAEVVLPHVPTWLLIDQPNAINWFYEGAPPGMPLPWREWVSPISSWTLFAFSAYLGLFCLAALVRRDWIESQRLAFPLAAVPLEVAGDAVPSDRSRIFRNPMLWLGFSLPVIKSLLQMANAFSPVEFHRGYDRLHRLRDHWDSGAGAGRGLPQSVGLLLAQPVAAAGLRRARIRGGRAGRERLQSSCLRQVPDCRRVPHVGRAGPLVFSGCHRRRLPQPARRAGRS